MKVAVTGAAGGLGSALVKHLKQSGFSIHALITPQDSETKIQQFCDRIMVGSIENLDQCLELVDGCDSVINCAALLPNSLDKVPKEKFFSVNTEGAKNVYTAAQKRGLKQAVFLSTIGVVDHTKQLQRDNLYQFRTEGLDAYSLSKIAIETFLQQQMERDFPKISIVRPAFIYGPDSTQIWLGIIDQIRNGNFKVLGNGSALFPVVYDQDLARFLIELISQKSPAKPQPLIVAGPDKITSMELFSLFAKELNAPKIRGVPVFLAWIAATLADLTPARLKWGPLLLLSKRRVREYSRGYDLSLVNSTPGNWFTQPEQGIQLMFESLRRGQSL